MSYSRQHASNGWRANKGWKHACTEGNLVRVRTADCLREGASAGQGERHEHAALHERRQRQAPGHHLGRIRANREQPQPRRVREWRLDEVDAQALIVRLRKTMADLAFGATAMASIFAIVDPLGVVPFFSVLTEDLSAAQKQDIVSKACLTATITLGVFAVFGQWIFAGFGFTLPAFKIAGGALLFGVALEMLNGERSRSRLKILPSAEEDRRIQGVGRDVMKVLEGKIAAKGLRAKPLLVGSVAKGVHLTGTEIDIFVAFPPDTAREVLEREGLALGDVLERPVRMYAEHPYTRGWYGGFEVEVVPCYRITDATQRMSAVDRTPLHVDYVLGHVKEGQQNDVRLLKAWAEGIGVYGAEAKVLGFSGYLCELLVLKYGSFRGVLENSLSWRPTTVLELDRPPARTFTEPLVVVDPVDPNRNVASAVGVEQMATFVHAARAYLQAPNERFFFPRPLNPLPLPKLRALARKRGAGLLAISIPAPTVTEDVLYPQLRKAHRSFADLLHRNVFQVFDSRFDVVGKEAVFLFELDVESLPRASRHEGPPVWVKNAKDFLDKWRRSPKTMAGPYIHGERWAVDVTSEATTAAGLVKAKWRELGLGKDLEKTARTSVRIGSGGVALRAAYSEAWTRLFDRRFPWER